VARSLTAKLAFGIVVLSLGGVGYAAQTGALPAAAQDAAHRWLGAVGVPGSDHGTSDPGQPGTSQGTVTATPDQPTATPSGVPSTPPTADPNGRSLVSLCQDYDDGDPAALTAPELRQLGKAAGGADRIAAYCADVLAQDQDQGEDDDAQGAPHTPPTPPTPPTEPTPPTSPPTGGPGSGQGQGHGNGNGNGNAYGYGESQGGGPPASPPGQVKVDKVDNKPDPAEDVVAETDTESGEPTTTAPTTTVLTTTPS
jgi:hypothetical protein